MSSLPYARNYRELEVYKRSRELTREIYSATRSFPKEETYSLTDQIRRSSRSVGAQIAEAWAKRRYPKHFASKLSDADGEQNETQHWIEVSHDSGYISEEIQQHLLGLCIEIGRMLGSMIQKAEGFSGDGASHLSEEALSYLTSTPNLNTEH